MPIEIKRLQAHEVSLFQDLLILFNEVFECDDPHLPSQMYLHELLAKQDFVTFVVLQNGKVLGGLTAYILAKYYSEGAELYLYDLAIDPEVQRQGLATQLMEEIKNFCKSKGILNLFVDAHEDDLHALEFYRFTGGKGEKVILFNYDL